MHRFMTSANSISEIFCPKLNPPEINRIHHFLTLPNKTEKCLCIRFLCLSVCLPVLHLILVNILQLSLNLCMLFISDRKWTVLKMMCVALRVRLHTKVFRDISVYGEGIIKAYCYIYILH